MKKPKTPEQLAKDIKTAHDFFCGSVVDDLGLSPGAFRVFFHFKRRAGSDGLIKCGIRSIKKVCGMDGEWVIRSIHELEDRGLIECEKKFGRATRYTINAPQKWVIEKPDRTVKPNGFEANGKTVADSNRTVKPNTPYGKTERSPYGKTERKASPLKGNPKKASSTGVSHEHSSVSGSGNGSHDDDEMLVTGEGEASASANGENGHAEPNHVAAGLTPKEEQLVELLTDEHVTADVAVALVKEFPERIRNHVGDFQFRREKSEKHSVGWLVKSIRKKYVFHPDFKTEEDIAAARAKWDARCRESQKAVDDHQAKVDECRKRDAPAIEYIAKLSAEDLAVLQKAVAAESPIGRAMTWDMYAYVRKNVLKKTKRRRRITGVA